MEILSVVEMRELERQADMKGLRYAQMLQNAGRGAAHVIRTRISVDRQGREHRVLVLVGSGNNGGDGLVCATALAASGAHVRCWLLQPRPESDAVFADAQAAKIEMAVGDLDALREWLADATAIVDALIGTGVSRPIDGKLRDALREVRGRSEAFSQSNIQPTTCIALDGPTGMNYDTGALDPATVPADVTITFHAPKRGHYCYPAAEACGELIVIPIGIEAVETVAMGDWRLKATLQPAISHLELVEPVALADDERVRALLPSRKLDSNKGSHGRAVVAGGSSDYIGAPIMSAMAAYRIGAGLVALAVPDEVKAAAAQALREAIFVSRNANVATSLLDFVSKIKDGAAVLIGPGLGLSEATTAFVDTLTRETGLRALPLKGLVCDADALNTLAKMPGWAALLPPLTVLTPHAGEMSRLTDMTIAEVQADRIGNALRFSRKWGHVVLLKGAYTVIASPDGRGAVLPFANSAMATAGTGDVLAGCIVGLLAQGMPPFEAAVCGGYLHGAAGERWRARHGDAGLLAGDLLPLLPDVMRDLKRVSEQLSN